MNKNVLYTAKYPATYWQRWELFIYMFYSNTVQYWRVYIDFFFFLNSYQHSSGKDRVLEWQKQQKFSLLKLWKGINLSHLHRDIPQHCLMFERHLKKRKVKKLRESKREKLQIAWISFSLLKLLTIQQITIFPQTQRLYSPQGSFWTFAFQPNCWVSASMGADKYICLHIP